MKLNLVVIRASNLAASVAFYESLGLIFAQEQHGNGPIHFACDLGGVIFEIYPGTDAAKHELRLGFIVELQIDQLITQIEQSGLKVASRPKDSPWGRRAVVADPDGYQVELTEKCTDARI